MLRRRGTRRRRRARSTRRCRRRAPRPCPRGGDRTRRSAGSSSCPGRNEPRRTSRPDGVASASSRTVSPIGSCRRRLSTASRRSSTRSMGSSKRAATPPRTSLPTLRYPAVDGNSTVARSGGCSELGTLTRPRPRRRALRRDLRAGEDAIEQRDLEDAPDVRVGGDDADPAARRAKPLDCAEEHPERHRVDEGRLGQVDHEAGRAPVERGRDRLPQLGGRVEICLTADGDQRDGALRFDRLHPELGRLDLAHRCLIAARLDSFIAARRRPTRCDAARNLPALMWFEKCSPRASCDPAGAPCGIERCHRRGHERERAGRDDPVPDARGSERDELRAAVPRHRHLDAERGVGRVDPHRVDGAEPDAAGAHGCAEQRSPVVVRQLRDPTARASSALFIFERPSMPFSLASS